MHAFCLDQKREPVITRDCDAELSPVDQVEEFEENLVLKFRALELVEVIDEQVKRLRVPARLDHARGLIANRSEPQLLEELAHRTPGARLAGIDERPVLRGSQVRLPAPVSAPEKQIAVRV